MTQVLLVRHAKPAATWGEAIDPGLDEQGSAQAAAAAERIRGTWQPMPILTSPLARCRETAAPLASAWQREAKIFAPLAEIPSPPLAPPERQQWLNAGMQGTWTQLQASAPPGSPDYLAWRADVIRALFALEQDCVIFTHYIAINVAVGAAQGHDRVLSFKPNHASITHLEVTHADIRVCELGEQVAETSVLLGR